MCGILTCVRSDGGIDPVRLEAALATLTHRGPDHQGIVSREGVFLGHRRLKILDLSDRANQPMYSADRRYTIVFNGEIYNFRQLRSDLESRGVRFRTSGDTEVLLELYAQYGEECLERLNGMFTFVVYDWEKKELFAARDRLGIKPLFYTCGHRSIGIASEIQALLHAGLADRQLDETALEQYLAMGSVEGPLTIIRDVNALLPGHFIRWRDDSLQTKCYWRPPYVPEAEKIVPNRADAVAELSEMLEQSVKRQLISDVPLGVFLSGGIDSSTVVALMSRLGVEDIKTFSIGFDVGSEAFNETQFARQVAERYATDHHEIILRGEDIAAELPTFVRHLDQPTRDGLNTYFVSKFARQHVTVCLSGMGGDELFAGYHTAKWLSAIDGYERRIPVPALLSGPSWKGFYEKLPLRLQRSKMVRGACSLMGAWPTKLQRYRMVRTLFTDNELSHLMIRPGRRAQHGTESQYALAEALSSVDAACYLDKAVYLNNTLLRDVDVMSMAHSLEVRVPLLDDQLVEYAATLPSSMKYANGQGKHLLIEAIKDWIPSEVINRRKMGFSFPIGHWMRGGFLKEIMMDCLAALPGRGIFHLVRSRALSNGSCRAFSTIHLHIMRRSCGC